VGDGEINPVSPVTDPKRQGIADSTFSRFPKFQAVARKGPEVFKPRREKQTVQHVDQTRNVRGHTLQVYVGNTPPSNAALGVPPEHIAEGGIRGFNTTERRPPESEKYPRDKGMQEKASKVRGW